MPILKPSGPAAFQPLAKTLRKGDILYQESDPAQFIYLIQSGLLSIAQQGAKKNIELYQLTAPQLAGEESLLTQGKGVHRSTAVALNDTSILVIPVALAFQMLAQG